ncbi:MAG: protein of unknown function DUF4157 [Bacteriophage sp.]|nr:MAG: protein of unknown function DUF4157 [Bacteriophage sp.]
MKFKYDKQRKLLFFINSLFPVKGYQYMNICGILFTRNESAIDRMTDSTVRHEVTHTKQIIEMGIIFYYLWYVIEWLIRLLIMADSHKAYRAISFEKESRAAGADPNYNRKVFQYRWINYL